MEGTTGVKWQVWDHHRTIRLTWRPWRTFKNGCCNFLAVHSGDASLALAALLTLGGRKGQSCQGREKGDMPWIRMGRRMWGHVLLC